MDSNRSEQEGHMEEPGESDSEHNLPRTRGIPRPELPAPSALERIRQKIGLNRRIYLPDNERSFYDLVKERFPFMVQHRLFFICFTFFTLFLLGFVLFCSFFFSPSSLPAPTIPDKIAKDSFRFLTLNIFMRPPLIRNNWSDYKDDRLAYIEKYILPDYDVIVFQEAFAFASKRKDHLIRRARELGFNYHLESPRKYPWQLGIDGGLLLLSRFPIRQSHRIEYPRGTHADWFSVKGVLHALIELNPERHIHLYTTHTQASYDLNNIINPGDTEIRLSQFKRLREFVQETSKEGHPVLIAGDLNVDAATHPKERPIEKRSRDSSPEYLQMVDILTFEDLHDIVYGSLGYHPVTFGDYTIDSEGKLVPAETALTNSDQWMTVQSIDRMFWAPRNTALLDPQPPQVEKFWVKDNTRMTKEEKEATKFTQISDHYGLSCTFFV